MFIKVLDDFLSFPSIPLRIKPYIVKDFLLFVMFVKVSYALQSFPKHPQG
jgi:hypothetical protein